MQTLPQPELVKQVVPLPDGLPEFLHAVAEPNRLRILVLLARREHCVCEIEAALDLPQNLVSHHLAALRRARAVNDRREGKWVYYTLNREALRPHLRALVHLLDTGDPDTVAPACQGAEL